MQSLRVKLIAPFIAGTLVLTILLAWYTYSSARRAVEEAMLLISENKTAQTYRGMNFFFKSMMTNLQNLVADPHVLKLFKDNDEAVRRSASTWLEIVTQGNDYYRDVLVVDHNGICVVSSNPGHIGTSFAELQCVREALTGRFSLGESSVGKVTKRFTSMAAGPVDGENGVAGALLLMNDYPRLVDYSTAAHDSQTIFTALLDPEGVFQAHKDVSLMGNEVKVHPELYKRLSSVGTKGATISYELDGVPYVGFARLDQFTNWLILTSGVTSEVFAPAYRVGATVLGISIAFLCVIAFVVVRFANGILTTLLALINYARHVSEGELDRPLAETSRNDELGILYHALQRLVHSLRAMLRETEQASKMKGEFLANMSHEIRTPLNAIIGMTHLSLNAPDLVPGQKKYLDNIQLAAKSLLGLINDILDLSKVEAGMLELEETPFNFRDTVENILAIHQETARSKGLLVSMNYAYGTPERFIGDPLRIGQVLNNLLSNALKFTKQGGVTVTCSAGEESPGLLELGHAQLNVAVTDTGIGIAPEVVPTLFKSFTQADASITRQFGGTGLGLAICDKIVSLLGGGFTVTSEPGKGTTFAFTMVLQLDSADYGDSAEDLPLGEAFAQLKLEGKKILVAEDNMVNQMIMEELIMPSGAEVHLVENGSLAVEAVRESHFDLVFMDMQMPVMGGLEATRAIRTFKGKDELPIIAVTANAMKQDKETGFAIGMNDYITKPVEPKQLLESLRVWLGTTSAK